ncbi:hypothetical protein, partial [Bilophila sp. 4_1_30]|uniref:hypothetical protein n=1 Tax=Bilophila sp. 4_1_30 TaxID=693988 RepID=UPI000587C460
MNDAEIMELVDEVRRCERAVQQAKNALEIAKRDAPSPPAPTRKRPRLRMGSRRHQSGKGRQNPVHPSYPYY